MREIGNVKNRLRRWFQNLLQKKKKKEKEEQERNYWRKIKNRFTSGILTLGIFFLGFFFNRSSISLDVRVKKLKKEVEKEKEPSKLEEYQKELFSLQKESEKEKRNVQKKIFPLLQETSLLLLTKKEARKEKTPTQTNEKETKEKEKKEIISKENKESTPILEEKKDNRKKTFFITQEKEGIKENIFSIDQEKEDVHTIIEPTREEVRALLNEEEREEKKEENQSEDIYILFLLKECLFLEEKLKEDFYVDIKDTYNRLIKLEEKLKKYDIEEITSCIEKYLLPISLEKITQKTYFSSLYEKIKEKEKKEEFSHSEEKKQPSLLYEKNSLPIEKKASVKKEEKKKPLEQKENKITEKKTTPKVELRPEYKVEKEEVSDYQKSFFYIQKQVDQYYKELLLKRTKRGHKNIGHFIKRNFHFALFFPMSAWTFFKNPLYGMLTSSFFLNNSIRHVYNFSFEKKKQYLSARKLLLNIREENSLLWLTHSIFSDALLQLQELKSRFYIEYKDILTEEEMQRIKEQMEEMEAEINQKLEDTKIFIQEQYAAKQKILR